MEDSLVKLLDLKPETLSAESDWNFTNGEKPESLVSVCDSAVLFGGHNIFKGNLGISKTFDTSRIPSQLATLQFDIFFIDSWEGQKLHLKYNGITLWTFQPENRVKHYYNLCGNFTYDDYQHFSIQFRHIEPYLTIELSPELSEPLSEGSWGIRKFSIDLNAQCQSKSVKLTTTRCDCLSGFLKKSRDQCSKTLYKSNYCFDCLTCPARCLKCTDVDECSQCLPGFVLVRGKCDSPDCKTF